MSRTRKHLLGLCVLTAVAWLPSIRAYLPLGDDFVHFLDFSRGVSKYLETHLQLLSISRMLGDAIVWSLNQGSPWVYPIVALILHAVCSCVLYYCIRLYWNHAPLAFMLSAIFAVSPFGFTAIYWASAFPYAVVTLVFLLLLIGVKKSLEADSHHGFKALWIACAVVINAMIWDHMVVAMMGLGAWVCVHAFEREKNLSQMVNYTISKQRWLILFAPVSMCLLYIVLYFHFQVPGAHHQSSFNFATLFSPFYYQYTLIYAYYPLADLAVWELAPVALAMGCVLALASGVWVFTSLRTDNHDKTNDEPSWRRLIARTAYLGLLLWGAVSIYALAGGYALDTRKRYAIVALLLLACAGLFAKLMNQKSMRSFLRYLCSMLVVLGIVANWATIFAWNFEARRYHAMLDNVIQAEPQEPFSVRLQPDFRKTNPTMELLWGNDLYRPVKIDQALRFSGVHDVPDVVQDSEHILSYQNQTWEWKQISHE